jgi:Zn-dependent protease with chaperone function
MATDFFDRQDHARRLTWRLLVLFFASVLAIILAIYVALALGLMWAEPVHDLTRPWEQAARFSQPATPSVWNPQLFAGVTLGTILVIALGSLYKIAELSAGGENVALLLGGRAVDPQTRNLAERQLLNVVEEMALASGVPVPPVYVLDQEPSLNAFAAGHQPGDAVVAVSAGCLKYLTREELQGVIGHEFSHILNGDMRLNLRLIGLVNGILVLAILGYYCMRMVGYSSGGSSKREGASVAILAVGLVLLIFGYLGVFFGNLIKSAINREREFLADASAVQFTRYPGGIAGALKKIGGLALGSRIHDAHAAEVSHMFFGDAFAGSFFNLFATHPPLEQRIRALEPEFDGHFPRVAPLAIAGQEVEEAAPAGRPLPLPLPLPGSRVLPGGDALAGAAMGLSAEKFDAQKIVQQIGQPDSEHLRRASQIIEGMPPQLQDAAREPFAAQAVIFVLLLSRDDEAAQAAQMQILLRQIAAPLYEEVQRLRAAAESLPAAARLPLVDLTLPAIKRCSPQQYEQFRQVVEALVTADHKVDLFEYCLRTVLFSYLDVHFGRKKPPSIGYRTIAAVASQATAVLSTLAYVGQTRVDDVQRAFEAGARCLAGQWSLLPQPQCTLKAFDAALAELARGTPNVKRDVVSAVTACIAADGTVTLEESELLRVVAAVLACPVPPATPATVAG